MAWPEHARKATQFKPGNPGGPGRPPRERSLTALLREFAEADDKAKARAVAAKAFDLALNGDLNAIRFIFDRLDGKVPDQLHVEDKKVQYILDDEIISIRNRVLSNGQTSEAAQESD